jgi:hypothetical protein
MQTVVAGLERTLLEVKGLNAVAAGRTCQVHLELLPYLEISEKFLNMEILKDNDV